MNPSMLIEKLQWRYAVKKFDAAKKISAEEWLALEDSMVLTPSSYGLQPWKFLVVQSPELRKQLRPVSWNQSQVEDCSHYVVFAARTIMTEANVQKFIDRIAEVRQVPRESLKGYQEMMIGDVVNGARSKWVKEWAARQCYIALGQMMASAAMLSIDACPMEGIDPDKYDQILDLKKDGFGSIVALALGYRSKDDGLQNAKKVRFKKSELIDVR
jgi:nitroreductase